MPASDRQFDKVNAAALGVAGVALLVIIIQVIRWILR